MTEDDHLLVLLQQRGDIGGMIADAIRGAMR